MQLADRRPIVAPFNRYGVLREANAPAEAAGRRHSIMEVGQRRHRPLHPPTVPRGLCADATGTNSASGYTEGLDWPALRKGIAGLYKRCMTCRSEPRRVIVMQGSSLRGIHLSRSRHCFGGRSPRGGASAGYPSSRSIL